MLKSVCAALSLVVLVLSAFPLDAEGNPKALYERIVMHKIQRCEGKCRLVHSRGERVRLEGEKASRMAAFYRNNQERLVSEMLREDIGRSVARVQQFLIVAYRNDGHGAR